jgi:hypothetical protein
MFYCCPETPILKLYYLNLKIGMALVDKEKGKKWSPALSSMAYTKYGTILETNILDIPECGYSQE